MTDTNPSVKPIRPAASLLIVRDGVSGVEILTLKRSRDMRAFPGFLAFPGGAIAGDDQELAAQCFTGEVLAQGQVDDTLYAAGAVRECAEEIGWACALSSPGSVRALTANEQQALLDGTTSFRQLLQSWQAQIDACHLRFVGRWLTPAFMPVRFDTRFFCFVVTGEMPPFLLYDGENEWVQWASPTTLLASIKDKAERAAPPTIAMLKAIAQAASAAACLSGLTVPQPPEEELEFTV